MKKVDEKFRLYSGAFADAEVHQFRITVQFLCSSYGRSYLNMKCCPTNYFWCSQTIKMQWVRTVQLHWLASWIVISMVNFPKAAGLLSENQTHLNKAAGLHVC